LANLKIFFHLFFFRVGLFSNPKNFFSPFLFRVGFFFQSELFFLNIFFHHLGLDQVLRCHGKLPFSLILIINNNIFLIIF
jgi:hypothetical protein